ncbi:FecR family protein [Mucilaginibacter sp. Mucisp84]|uniref:FecR family protein n=1 Tax=Mucilaginibacter sp. Mucisp84 TaxID=3243058 RepID=UPI0039A778E5
MTREQAQELLNKHQLGKCTPEEQQLLDHWYLSEAAKQQVADEPANPLKDEKLIWDRITKEIPEAPKIIRFKKWYSTAAAAAAVIFVSFGTWFFIRLHQPVKQLAQQSYIKNDILPGGNKAILMLANGKQITLTGARNGTLAVQGGVAVNKTADGRIVYNSSKQTASEGTAKLAYNTMITPRGGQYWVVLPDGSKVLLNAASSLTYPTTFSGNERKVELIGEAYFEVAHNAAKPFKVYSKSQVVEVLGTHFNINTYDDEPDVRTTLLEGKVKVTSVVKNQVRILKPGQQAALNPLSFNVNDVDVEEATAWKNGIFIFESNDIQQIMRMVSRWYDVDVIYKGNLPTDKFTGSVSRFSNVSQVLNTLQLTRKVRFKIEDKKITVSE